MLERKAGDIIYLQKKRNRDGGRNVRKGILLVALLVTAAILVGCSGSQDTEDPLDLEIQYPLEESGMWDHLSGEDYSGVILENVADVFVEPDVKSDRVSQVIYNQPVNILEEKQGWSRVNAADGSMGWIRSKFISKDISSVSGRSYTSLIIVTGKSKSIFSAPSGGVTLKDLFMGTALLAFNISGSSQEVFLPGNKTGWVRESGILQIEKDGNVKKTSGKDFAASAIKFKGTSYLVNGLSAQGIDAAGLNYICAVLNGVKMPRKLAVQDAYGADVPIEDAQTGDVFFFYGRNNPETPVFSGILTADGFLYTSSSVGYVKLGSLEDPYILGFERKVRRIFD